MTLKRLYRRIRWLLLTQWRSLSLKKWPYESCQLCGRGFKVRWTVEDKYWNELMGGENGCLCVDCFIEEAEFKGIDFPDSAIEIHVFRPRD